MLRKLSSWDDEWSGGDGVVGQEDNLQKVSNCCGSVDFVLDSVDQLNNVLGICISWSSLSSEHDDSWHKLSCSFSLWGVQNGQVSMNDVEDVHELSLVLVNSFDLDVIH